MSMTPSGALFALRCLELVEDPVHEAEPGVPGPLEVLDPVVHGLERRAVQPVQPLATLVPHGDEADLPEDPEVLRHLRLTEPEQRHEVVHRPLAVREQVEDLPSPWLRHRVEGVGGGCCPGHGGNIYRYRNMSSLRIRG